MQMNSRNASLLVMAVTALPCSRAAFALIDDPEGPNLLIVVVMAAIIYGLSCAFYLSSILPSLTGFKRTAAAILSQMIIAAVFYFGLR